MKIIVGTANNNKIINLDEKFNRWFINPARGMVHILTSSDHTFDWIQKQTNDLSKSLNGHQVTPGDQQMFFPLEGLKEFISISE